MAPTERPPSPQRILAALHGFERTAVLKAAIELDVFTAIAEGATDVAAIAARVGASDRGTRALVNTLVALDFLQLHGTRYALTPESARYLDRGSSAYLGGTATFLASRTMTEAFADATEAVRRGGSAPAVDSMTPSHPVWSEYARAMRPLFQRPAESVADLVLREMTPPPARILDVAAGHGLFGIVLAQRLPDATVTALDWPEVAELARAHAREAGVGARFQTIPGNAFDASYGTGWDLVIVANFLHHFDAATCQTLLRRIRGALREGGSIVIVEFVPNEDLVGPADVAPFAMTMLTTTPRGDVYRFSELSAMLELAGFRAPRLHELAHSPQRAVWATR
ncbi:MAG: methyltransferase domain-containing protein [Thermoplasmata archaeon]|nr:methyltransferase domain-containing protein [Thermoplasmata archaeon]